MFSRGSKKYSKIFTLRNINPEHVTRDHDDISQSKFDFGYLQGSNVVTITNKEDLVEVWANIKKGTKSHSLRLVQKHGDGRSQFHQAK